MKPIIIVCGANHSKTSQLMEIIMELGKNTLWVGDVSKDKHDVTPYNKYENKIFADICKPKFNLHYVKKSNETFSSFFAGLPKDKTVVLKYPKSIFVMNDIIKAAGERKVKIIYVLRDISDTIISTAIKTDKGKLPVFEDIRNTLQIAEYYRRSLTVSFLYDCFYAPTTYFDKFPRKPLNERLYNYIFI